LTTADNFLRAAATMESLPAAAASGRPKTGAAT
jgi:hypothetical protein